MSAAAAPPSDDDDGGARRVPTSVAAWWVARARRLADREGKRVDDMGAVVRLAARVSELSDLFTTDRPSAWRDYAREEAVRTAYGLFFFPQTWCRVRFVLAEAADAFGWRPPTERRARVLDVGAGTGAAGLSVAAWLRTRGATVAAEVVAFDHSERALEDARTLAAVRGLPWGDATLRTQPGDVAALADASDREPFDVVVAAHAFNEAMGGKGPGDGGAFLRALATRLAPDGLLVLVDPAPVAIARALHAAVREALAPGDLHAFGPAPYDGAWPADEGPSWPHEVRAWTPPASLLRLGQILPRDVSVLRFSCAALSPAVPRALAHGGALVGRTTSPVAPTKGRRRFTVLASNGRHLGVDVLTRGRSRADLAPLDAIERGDLVALVGATATGGDDGLRLPDPAAAVVLHHPA